MHLSYFLPLYWVISHLIMHWQEPGGHSASYKIYLFGVFKTAALYLERQKFSGRGTLSHPRSLYQSVWGQGVSVESRAALWLFLPFPWQPCPLSWHVPDFVMWCPGAWLSAGLGSGRSTAGLNGLEGLFQAKWFCL